MMESSGLASLHSAATPDEETLVRFDCEVCGEFLFFLSGKALQVGE